MSKAKLFQILKADGSKQRADTLLSQAIALSLRDLILSGQTIYPHAAEKLSLAMWDGEEKTIVELGRSQISNWVQRGNVIPETGQSMRDFIEECREEKRVQEHRAMVDQAEAQFKRTLHLDTLQPVVGKFGVMKDKETGEVIMRENTRLLEIQMKTAEFVTERLDPNHYGKVGKNENKHLHVFLLSDLRKAEEAMEAQREKERSTV